MNFVSYINYLKSKKSIKVKDNENIIVMSFNIRCVSKEDKGIRYYKFRAPFIRKVLEEENPDVIGFQEVKVKQYKYLLKILKEYDYVYRKEMTRKKVKPIQSSIKEIASHVLNTIHSGYLIHIK